MSASSTKFDHLRIPLDEIQKATINFSEKNIIGKGDFGYVYKGQLLHSGELINISARRLDRSHGLGVVEFLTEVSVLASLKHPNIVSLIGFCDEDGEKVIINSFEAKGSLFMYLDDPALTWLQRLRICYGVANAIHYIHYQEGRNYSIIHCNINSSTILLDDNFEPKLSGFEFSIRDSLDRTERFISSEIIRVQGYMDPDTTETGDVTQKLDVYAFGVVLCEIMCGRKAFLPGESEDSKFLAPLVKFHRLNKTLQDIIHPHIWNQVPTDSLEKFASTACQCLNKNRQRRPDMSMLPLSLDLMLKQESQRIKMMLMVEKVAHNSYLMMQSKKETMKVRAESESSRASKVKKDRMNALLQSRKETRATFDSISSGPSKDKVDKFNALVRRSKKELRAMFESAPSEAWKVNKFEYLRIPFIDIQLATNNFSKESTHQSRKDYIVYKGDLECFDREYVSSLEDKNIGELPKRLYNNVRIKCINNANAEAMFRTEIEVLSACKHKNIVSLLGFCDEDRHMILVYEDINMNTSLQDSLTKYRWYTLVKICYSVVCGLNYIHNEMEDQKVVIHRQINSNTIFVDRKHPTKISGFGLSTFLSSHQDEDTGHLLESNLDIISRSYMAPEFRETGKATKESDIYSFGLVMFEILCGMPYPLYRVSSESEHWFRYETMKQKVAQTIKEENHENKLFLKKGPNEDSLDTFIKIVEQCLAVNPEQRPTLQVIIMELRKALMFQKNHKDHLRMSFKDIESATQKFSRANDIGGGGFGRAYIGKLASEHGFDTIVAKRLDTRLGQGDQQFYNELHILSEYKHENVIGLVGYNNDEQERIIVYEYASKGSLDKCLNYYSLTWINRLNICIDVARGLAFLHGGVREHEAVIHRDIKTANILLFDDLKAKVADFGLSLICTISAETDYVIDHACGTRGYLDPLYEKSRVLTKESDVYSFGVVLLEILCGRSTYEVNEHEGQFLHSLVKQHFEEGRLDEVVFHVIKNQIVPQSLAAFLVVAFQCLDNDREQRPTAQHVLVQLQKALELQVNDVPVCKAS